MKNGCTAILVAAGSAQRMQGIDKIMTRLCGVPLLLHTVRALAQSVQISAITVVTRKNLLEQVKCLCANEEKVTVVVPGGDSRAESVLCGLQTVQTTLVAIHDGARPLVTTPIIDAAIQAARECGAAAPAIAVHDTVKIARNNIVQDTPDRATLFAVQTPQAFQTEAIRQALLAALRQGLALTDDCSAAEAAGMTVRLTAGSEENLKITVPSDLTVAEAILKRREAQCESGMAMTFTA